MPLEALAVVWSPENRPALFLHHFQVIPMVFIKILNLPEVMFKLFGCGPPPGGPVASREAGSFIPNS